MATEARGGPRSFLFACEHIACARPAQNCPGPTCGSVVDPPECWQICLDRGIGRCTRSSQHGWRSVSRVGRDTRAAAVRFCPSRSGWDVPLGENAFGWGWLFRGAGRAFLAAGAIRRKHAFRASARWPWAEERGEPPQQAYALRNCWARLPCRKRPVGGSVLPRASSRDRNKVRHAAVDGPMSSRPRGARTSTLSESGATLLDAISPRRYRERTKSRRKKISSAANRDERF